MWLPVPRRDFIADHIDPDAGVKLTWQLVRTRGRPAEHVLNVNVRAAAGDADPDRGDEVER